MLIIYSSTFVSAVRQLGRYWLTVSNNNRSIGSAIILNVDECFASPVNIQYLIFDCRSSRLVLCATRTCDTTYTDGRSVRKSSRWDSSLARL